MSVSRDLSEADIIFNRASLALAKSQRLIASWLPPKTLHETAAKKTEEELEKEDSELFSPMPELLGVGASVPPEEEARSSRGTAKPSYLEDKLRTQLLGKRESSAWRRNNAASNPRSSNAPSTKRKLRDTQTTSESEDEMGRTSLGSKALRSTTDLADRERLQLSPQAAFEVNPSKADQVISRSTPAKKRFSSYLDEVLVSRSSKRKKKQNTTQRGHDLRAPS